MPWRFDQVRGWQVGEGKVTRRPRRLSQAQGNGARGSVVVVVNRGVVLLVTHLAIDRGRRQPLGRMPSVCVRGEGEERSEGGRRVEGADFIHSATQ